MTTGEGFARPELLVDTEWLAAHLDDPNLVVVDGDVEAGYLRGHVPGAALVPDNYEKDPDTGRVHILPPDKFAAMCQNLGIGDDTLVVTYDNNQSLYAARLWWALNYYGHSNVKVLDGGWRRWVSEGRPVSFDRARPNTEVTFTPQADESVMVKVDELKAACRPGGRGDLGRAQRRGIYRGQRPGQPAGRPHPRRGASGVVQRDGAGQPPLQAGGGNPPNAHRPRHHPGQGRIRLLTGRHPCGARHLPAQALGL